MILSPKWAAITSLAIVVSFAVGLTPVMAQPATLDTAQVVLQESDVSLDGHLTFSGRGFSTGEPTSVTVEDDQGGVQAHLEPVNVETDGQVYMVSVPVPNGLAPGAHTLRVTGLTSGRFGRAAFNLRWQTPVAYLEAYTAKPTQAVGFGGSGFVPGESVDVFLGDQTLNPLVTVTADGLGRISGHNIGIPFLGTGDYRVSFIGRSSQTPVSVGFNIQGFHPWVVLHNYYLLPRAPVGFDGEDFIPGEPVHVYLNSTVGPPVTQVTADAQGRFSLEKAFALPDLSGDNQIIFVGQLSQTELTTTFTVARE